MDFMKKCCIEDEQQKYDQKKMLKYISCARVNITEKLFLSKLA